MCVEREALCVKKDREREQLRHGKRKREICL